MKFKLFCILLVGGIIVTGLSSCSKNENTGNQTSDTVFMVRPVAFEYNTQTSKNNAFQIKGKEKNTQELARAESDDFIKLLKDSSVNVVTVEDTKKPHTPDSVFPNNWFTTHEDGTLVLYPMFAENRRLERKSTAIAAIKKNFDVKRTVDLTSYEKEGKFLEGTGSMVLDRVNKIVYACRSPRTNEDVLDDFCKQLGYTSVVFDAVDQNGEKIYHTNVMMNVGTDIAVVCTDSIKNAEQKKAVIESLENNGKEIIEISFEQMNNFAGNMLEVKNVDGEACLILSKTAYNCLKKEQLEILNTKFKLITPDIGCIETNGGGSARCMVAEIF